MDGFITFHDKISTSAEVLVYRSFYNFDRNSQIFSAESSTLVLETCTNMKIARKYFDY